MADEGAVTLSHRGVARVALAVEPIDSSQWGVRPQPELCRGR